MVWTVVKKSHQKKQIIHCDLCMEVNSWIVSTWNKQTNKLRKKNLIACKGCCVDVCVCVLDEFSYGHQFSIKRLKIKRLQSSFSIHLQNAFKVVTFVWQKIILLHTKSSQMHAKQWMGFASLRLFHTTVRLPSCMQIFSVVKCS